MWRTDERTYEQTDERTDERTDEQTDERTDERMNNAVSRVAFASENDLIFGPQKLEKIIFFQKKPEFHDLTEHWGSFPQLPWWPGQWQTSWVNLLNPNLALAPCALWTLAIVSRWIPKTPFYGLWKHQEWPELASKWHIFMVLNHLHLLGMLFWFDHGGSLSLKPISTMDLCYCVQMNP